MDGLEKAIDFFGGHGRGGQARLAEALNVPAMCVSHWKKRGIPSDRCADIERVTDGAVTRAELKPEVFGPVIA